MRNPNNVQTFTENIVVPACEAHLIALNVDTANDECIWTGPFEADVRDVDLQTQIGKISAGSPIRLEQGNYTVEYPEVCGMTVDLMTKVVSNSVSVCITEDLPKAECMSESPVTITRNDVLDTVGGAQLPLASGGISLIDEVPFTGLPWTVNGPLVAGASTGSSTWTTTPVFTSPSECEEVVVDEITFTVNMTQLTDVLGDSSGDLGDIIIGIGDQGVVVEGLASSSDISTIVTNISNFAFFKAPLGQSTEVEFTVNAPSNMSLSQAFSLTFHISLERLSDFIIENVQRRIVYTTSNVCPDQVPLFKDCNPQVTPVATEVIGCANNEIFTRRNYKLISKLSGEVLLNYDTYVGTDGIESAINSPPSGWVLGGCLTGPVQGFLYQYSGDDPEDLSAVVGDNVISLTIVIDSGEVMIQTLNGGATLKAGQTYTWDSKDSRALDINGWVFTGVAPTPSQPDDAMYTLHGEI